MANVRGKEVDTTCLSIDNAVSHGWIHRDYIAHVLRWSHVAKYMRQERRHQTAHLLDVGCGREVPLMKYLYHAMLTHTTGSYTGIDYGKVPWPPTIKQGTTKFNASLHEKTDFVKWAQGLEWAQPFDVVVSFEVLEHVEPWHAYQMLTSMRRVAQPRARIFISTPCFDPKAGAAANHVNEMTFNALRGLIGLAGFTVEKVWGTFANQRDYKKELTPEIQALFNALAEYHSTEILANMFAPLFPEQSRNCLWRLVPGTIELPTAQELKALDQPGCSSSDKWQTDLKRILTDAKKRAK